jgi:hypothetical protein
MTRPSAFYRIWYVYFAYVKYRSNKGCFMMFKSKLSWLIMGLVGMAFHELTAASPLPPDYYPPPPPYSRSTNTAVPNPTTTTPNYSGRTAYPYNPYPYNSSYYNYPYTYYPNSSYYPYSGSVSSSPLPSNYYPPPPPNARPSAVNAADSTIENTVPGLAPPSYSSEYYYYPTSTNPYYP